MVDDTPPHDHLDGDAQAAVDMVFSVTNPPATVTVSTCLDGRVQNVELARQVAAMSETGLAEEIVVIAGLATQCARAAQYQSVLTGMVDEGHDAAATRDFLARDLALPSPADARAAQARVFATRYADSHD